MKGSHNPNQNRPFSLSLYRALTMCSAPALSYILYKRLKRGKEDPDRVSERRGIASRQRPPGHLIWIHAVSVGESLSALTFMTKLLHLYPESHILLTTGTLTSARLISSRLPQQAIHQFSPLDHPAYVARFLDHWRPDIAFVIESELWPNLIRDTASRDIPIALINARMSETSYKTWKRWPQTIKYLLACFDICLAQDQQSAVRLNDLGAPDTLVMGNLKFAAPALPVDESTLLNMQNQVGARPLWLAASTHPGEEEIMAKAHKILSQSFPDLLTIIIPRHPERGADLKVTLHATGLGSALRSSNEPISSTTAIYIADTIGELGLFYRLAPVAFIGGSLIAHGGQNPLEPIRVKCAILHGPHAFNFADIYRELDEREASLMVNNAEDLAHEIQNLLTDKHRHRTQTEAASAILTKNGDVIERCFTALRPFLADIDPAQPRINAGNPSHARP